MQYKYKILLSYITHNQTIIYKYCFYANTMYSMRLIGGGGGLKC